ncbi:unnamed protein product [Lampetra planeri]
MGGGPPRLAVPREASRGLPAAPLHAVEPRGNAGPPRSHFEAAATRRSRRPPTRAPRVARVWRGRANATRGHARYQRAVPRRRPPRLSQRHIPRRSVTESTLKCAGRSAPCDPCVSAPRDP